MPVIVPALIFQYPFIICSKEAFIHENAFESPAIDSAFMFSTDAVELLAQTLIPPKFVSLDVFNFKCDSHLHPVRNSVFMCFAECNMIFKNKESA